MHWLPPSMNKLSLLIVYVTDKGIMEMKFSLPDSGDNCEHKSISLVEICKIFEMQDTFFFGTR